ncbi:hypothetical protein N2152v2_005679 [Parachlorella kessleri]
MADPAPERAAGVLWTAALVLLTAVYVVWSEVVCLAKWSVHVCVIGAVRAVYDEWPDAGPQRRRRALIVTVALCMMLMCGMWLVAWGAGTHALKGGHVTAGGRDVVEMVVARAAAEKQGFVASRRRRGEAPLSMSGAAGSSDNGMDGWFGACFATARAWLGAGAATLSGAVVPAVLCSFGAGLVVCDLLLSVTILGEVERRWPQRTACIVRYLDVVGLEFGFVPARAPLLARRGHIFLHEERHAASLLSRQDGDLTLCQSPSIMRYLCDTQGMVADHWLPRDPRRRAQVNSALDWHLDNLRIGSMIVVWHRAVVLNLGQPGNERLVQDYGLPMLRNALKNLNDVWLGGKDFVGGGSQVSIADLLMACEIEMLRLLDAANQGPDFEELLAPHPQVRAWLARVAGVCSPHYQDVHSVLYKVRKAMLARKEKQQQQQQGTGSGSKL